MRGFDRWTMAWFLACVAFAAHVAEEIGNGSYGILADLELVVNAIAPWFQLPQYRYEVWVANLIGSVVVLFALTWLVRARVGIMRWASYLFAAFITLNGVAHLYSALTMGVYFPGAATATLLIFAGLYLFISIPKAETIAAAPR